MQESLTSKKYQLLSFSNDLEVVQFHQRSWVESLVLSPITDTCTCSYRKADFLISFEAWAKLAQKWLVCVPLGIHLEPIN